MTLREAQRIARDNGYVLANNPFHDIGEYRIVKRGGGEGRAYYTTDLVDALDTMYAEIQREQTTGSIPNPETPPRESVVTQLRLRAVSLMQTAEEFRKDGAASQWIKRVQDEAALYDEAANCLETHSSNPDVHIDIGSHNAVRRNPDILIASAGNSAVLIGKEVHKVFYKHVTEGNRVHEYGNGVRMEGLRDGSVRIFHPSKPVWENMK